MSYLSNFDKELLFDHCFGIADSNEAARAEKLIEDLTILDDDDVKKIGRKKKAVRLVRDLSLASQVLLERINDSKI